MLPSGRLSQTFCHLIISLFPFRYISIFVLKNPMAYHDDLFCFLICIWVTIFSLLFQFVLDFLPGKLPLNIHICTGKNPDLDKNKDKKIIRNYSILCCSIMMILLYAFVNIKIAISKRDPPKPPFSSAMQKIKRKPFADYLVVASIIFVTLINVSVVFKIQTIDMKESHIFPNYLYLYYQHLWLAPFYSTVFISTYFIRNRPIRDTFYREVKSLLARR